MSQIPGLGDHQLAGGRRYSVFICSSHTHSFWARLLSKRAGRTFPVQVINSWVVEEGTNDRKNRCWQLIFGKDPLCWLLRLFLNPNPTVQTKRGWVKPFMPMSLTSESQIILADSKYQKGEINIIWKQGQRGRKSFPQGNALARFFPYHLHKKQILVIKRIP